MRWKSVYYVDIVAFTLSFYALPSITFNNFLGEVNGRKSGAVVAEWLNSWLAEQEDRGSIPGLAT